MPIVNSRQSLKEYCLRKLGAPVMQINVDDDQVEDRIDDAVEMFFEYHADGLVKKFLAIELTPADIAAKKIPMPEHVFSVVKLFPITAQASNTSISFVAAMSDIWDSLRSGRATGAGGGAFRYFLVEQHLQMLQNLFNREKFVRYNKYQDFIEIDTDWDIMVPGDYILVEVWKALDMDTYERSWGNWWLISYATALIKQQWGMNMIKYDGFQLPSGITLNGRQIYDDAVAEISKLEDELRNTYQYPCDFFVG